MFISVYLTGSEMEFYAFKHLLLWTSHFFFQFKTELVENASSNIADRTVSRVLHGLEGAVITSVKEVSNHTKSAKSNPEFVERGPESPGNTWHHSLFEQKK